MKSIDREVVEDIRKRLDRPITMIGLMGAGKSKLGRMLAKVLGIPFVDADDEIEKAAGMSISEIFDRFGEEYFRDGERRVMNRLIDSGVRVIATGGGAVTDPDTAKAVWDHTISIWVRAEVPLLVERTSRNRNRPLLQKGDPEEILAALAAQRYPVYEKADIIIDSHNGPVEAIVNQALDKLDRYLHINA